MRATAAGYVSQLELLDAQRSELRNRRQALQVRSARYQSTVGLGPGARGRLGMSLLTVNLVLGTFVFWVAARIYVVPRLLAMGARGPCWYRSCCSIRSATSG